LQRDRITASSKIGRGTCTGKSGGALKFVSGTPITWASHLKFRIAAVLPFSDLFADPCAPSSALPDDRWPARACRASRERVED
jgi:hypothetical protein